MARRKSDFSGVNRNLKFKLTYIFHSDISGLLYFIDNVPHQGAISKGLNFFFLSCSVRLRSHQTLRNRRTTLYVVSFQQVDSSSGVIEGTCHCSDRSFLYFKLFSLVSSWVVFGVSLEKGISFFQTFLPVWKCDRAACRESSMKLSLEIQNQFLSFRVTRVTPTRWEHDHHPNVHGTLRQHTEHLSYPAWLWAGGNSVWQEGPSQGPNRTA